MNENDLKKLSDVNWLKKNPRKAELFKRLAKAIKPVRFKDNHQLEVIIDAMIVTGEEMINEWNTEDTQEYPVPTEKKKEETQHISAQQRYPEDYLEKALETNKRMGEIVLDFNKKQFDQFKDEADYYLDFRKHKAQIDKIEKPAEASSASSE
jgi:hypothetical protein